MQDEHINKTFSAIRHLPPQIGYESIQQLVLSQPPAIYIHHNHLWFNLKNIIIMTTSVSVISLLLVLNHISHVQPSEPVKEQQKEIVKKEIVIPQQENLPGQPAANIAVIPPPAEEKKKSKPAPVFTAVQPIAPATQKSIDPPKAVQESPVAEDTADPVSADAPVPAMIPDCNSHTPFPCNCPCNDGNNVTCTFKEKLLDDEIITDTEKFAFKLDGKGFTVNGKEQPENVFKKYSRIYKELTGKKLNEGSSMTVSVEKGNCSINININD